MQSLPDKALNQERVLNFYSLSGPWSKVQGISLQAGLFSHVGLSWKRQTGPFSSAETDFSLPQLKLLLWPIQTVLQSLEKLEKQSWNMQLMQDAWLRFLAGMVTALFISSREVQSVIYSFKLIFIFVWVPASHCLQWEIFKYLSILSE